MNQNKKINDWTQSYPTHCFYHPDRRLKKVETTRHRDSSGRQLAVYSCLECSKTYTLPLIQRE